MFHKQIRSGLFVAKTFKMLLLHVGKVTSCDIPQFAEKSIKRSFKQRSIGDEQLYLDSSQLCLVKPYRCSRV